MDSICVEFLSVLEHIQTKDCYLVVSPQQATVLQQVGTLRRQVMREPMAAWIYLQDIRKTLQKVVHDSASTKYRTFWQTFHTVSTTELPTLWHNLSQSIQVPIDALTFQAVSRQWGETLLPRTSKASCNSEEIADRVFSPEEEKAIMYASGFVLRKLQRKYATIDTASAAEFTETLVNLQAGGKYTDKTAALKISCRIGSKMWTEED